MATAEVPRPVVNSAQQSEPGVVEGVGAEREELQTEGEVLEPQYGGAYPPSNVTYQVIETEKFPNARPSHVSFAALRDPRLRVVRAIPLEITVEESTVIAAWPEIDEFGTGDTLSAAIDDFASALRELHHQLFAPNIILGPDLERIKQTVADYIQPRA